MRVVRQEDLVGVHPTGCPELLLTNLLIFVQSILGKPSEMSTVNATPLKNGYLIRVESSCQVSPLTYLGTVSVTGLLSLAECVGCSLASGSSSPLTRKNEQLLFFFKPSASKIRGLAVNFDPKI